MAIAYNCICGHNVLESDNGQCPKCGINHPDLAQIPKRKEIMDILSLLASRSKKSHYELESSNPLYLSATASRLIERYNEDRARLTNDYNQLVEDYNKLLDTLKRIASE